MRILNIKTKFSDIAPAKHLLLTEGKIETKNKVRVKLCLVSQVSRVFYFAPTSDKEVRIRSSQMRCFFLLP